MDRIIIQLKANGTALHRIFMQREAVSNLTSSLPEAHHNVLMADQSEAFKTTYTDLVNACIAIFEAKHPQVTEHFHNVKEIGADPYDATVTRTLYCNRVIDVIPGIEFQLPVVVRHFRNGIHISGEIPEFTIVLKGTKDRMIEVNGVMVSEYQHFADLSKVYPEGVIIDQQLTVEAAAGKFDRPAPQVELPQ